MVVDTDSVWQVVSVKVLAEVGKPEKLLKLVGSATSTISFHER